MGLSTQLLSVERLHLEEMASAVLFGVRRETSYQYKTATQSMRVSRLVHLIRIARFWVSGRLAQPGIVTMLSKKQALVLISVNCGRLARADHIPEFGLVLDCLLCSYILNRNVVGRRHGERGRLVGGYFSGRHGVEMW